MKFIFVIVISGSMGLLAHCCRRRDLKGDDPCPDPLWKCFLGFVLGVIVVVGYKYMFLEGADFTTMDLLVCALSAYAFSAFVYKLFCPRKL